MTDTDIDQLLSRARLIDHAPRLREHCGRTPEAAAPAGPVAGAADPLSEAANADLLALCEVLVARAPASALSRFITEQLPDPDGARVLGCILLLADSEEGARAWWQYASGAGDKAASYCLYLHHLSLGEMETAQWWYEQTATRPPSLAPVKPPARGQEKPPESWTMPENVREGDSRTSTVLRVFRQLLRPGSRRRSDLVDALVEFLPTAVAVGYVHDEPDVDLPLPGPDFADQVGVLVAAASAISFGDKPRPRSARHLRIQRRGAAAEGLDEQHQEDSEVEGAVRGGG